MPDLKLLYHFTGHWTPNKAEAKSWLKTGSLSSYWSGSLQDWWEMSVRLSVAHNPEGKSNRLQKEQNSLTKYGKNDTTLYDD